MGKPHPVELRRRVVDHVAEGNTHRSTAARFRVSVKFVKDMVKLKKASGGLLPKAQGNGGGHGKLSSLKGWVARRIAEKRDLTTAGLASEIAETHGMMVHRGSVWRLLRDLGLTHKKDLQAVEQKRPEVAAARHIWITRRQPFMANMLTRIGFIDETSVKTNMAKTTGWAPRGERLVDHAPFGHWHTQTFIAALRHDRLDAPWVIDGPINRDLFDLYVETQLAPTLQPGDVIILDKLSSHKSPKAAQVLRDIGCWFLPLPPYSPDLNPIEMAFAKLKALLRKAAARTYDDLWKAVGTVCDLFTENECLNYFIAAGYKPE